MIVYNDVQDLLNSMDNKCFYLEQVFSGKIPYDKRQLLRTANKLREIIFEVEKEIQKKEKMKV